MLRGNIALDIVEELRVRQWARRNWVPAAMRDQRWHRVILEEMISRDQELDGAAATVGGAVPLVESAPTLPRPHFLDRDIVRESEMAFDTATSELHFG